jgi:hypothetical protein
VTDPPVAPAIRAPGDVPPFSPALFPPDPWFASVDADPFDAPPVTGVGAVGAGSVGGTLEELEDWSPPFDAPEPWWDPPPDGWPPPPPAPESVACGRLRLY